MTIKHLVIGGGGPPAIMNYGIIKEANIQKIWNYNDIETIYCSSIGCLIGLIVLINLDWGWCDDYLIKRPWNKFINLNNRDYLRLIKEKGMYDIEIINKILEPLLKSVNLDITSTLQQLYDKFPKELHCFTCDINSEQAIELINISYKTHPNLLITEAIYMSSSVPFLAKPICINNKCYIDGCLLGNCPINDCLNETKCNINEIFCIKFNNSEPVVNIKNNTNTLSYTIELVKCLVNKLQKECDQNQNKLVCTVISSLDNKQINTWNLWGNILSNEKERNDLVKTGEIIFKNFLKNNKERIITLQLNCNENYKKQFKLYKTDIINIKRSYSF